MAGVKNPNSTSSLDRTPIEPAVDQGVTINEIEDRVRELYPSFLLAHIRTTSVLFAILKQGCSLQKLRSFTNYDFEFLLKRVEWLRSCGLLFTGSLSTQYVLDQVPGSEDLVERITGQKIIANTIAHKAPAGYHWERHLKAPPLAPPAPVAHSNGKEESMNTAINGAGDAAAVEIGEGACDKSPSCGKPANHMGRCKGQGGSAERARKRNANGQADQPKPKASKPKPAQSNGHKARPVIALTATAAEKDPGHFKIEYEDETETINLEGVGREVFARKLKMLYESFAGGSNG